MSRVTAVFRPRDYPGAPDEATKDQLAELFGTLFPASDDPAFDEHHAGMAIAALNPRLALNLARLSGFIAGELPWRQRRDLRELAIQAVNAHFRCDYSFRSRIAVAEAAGISAEMQETLSSWQASPLFSDEQRLVIEYANAVVSGFVPEPLFARLAASFGEKGAVECTTVIAFWSFWAMFLNALRPDQRPIGAVA